LNLGCNFDEKNPFVRGDKLSQDGEKGRLARSSSTADEDVSLCENTIFETICQGAVKSGFPDGILDVEMARIEFADGESHAF